jgi:hypothetical protein
MFQLGQSNGRWNLLLRLTWLKVRILRRRILRIVDWSLVLPPRIDPHVWLLISLVGGDRRGSFSWRGRGRKRHRSRPLRLVPNIYSEMAQKRDYGAGHHCLTLRLYETDRPRSVPGSKPRTPFGRSAGRGSSWAVNHTAATMLWLSR